MGSWRGTVLHLPVAMLDPQPAAEQPVPAQPPALLKLTRVTIASRKHRVVGHCHGPIDVLWLCVGHRCREGEGQAEDGPITGSGAEQVGLHQCSTCPSELLPCYSSDHKTRHKGQGSVVCAARTWVGPQLSHLGRHALAVCDLEQHQRISGHRCGDGCRRRRRPGAGRRHHHCALVLAHQAGQLEARQHRAGGGCGHGGCAGRAGWRGGRPQLHEHHAGHNLAVALWPGAGVGCVRLAAQRQRRGVWACGGRRNGCWRVGRRGGVAHMERAGAGEAAGWLVRCCSRDNHHTAAQRLSGGARRGGGARGDGRPRGQRPTCRMTLVIMGNHPFARPVAPRSPASRQPATTTRSMLAGDFVRCS